MKRRYIFCTITLLLCALTALAGITRTEKIAYPGGKCYLFRVTLKDKNTPANLRNNPTLFLSKRALERRIQQHLPIDSTDWPINAKYLAAVRALKSVQVVGKSKWNNTLLVKCNDVGKAYKLSQLPFVKSILQVFSSPDSINTSERTNFRKEFNRWDTLSSTDPYGLGKAQIAALNGTLLHKIGYRGHGKIIAVLDAGFMNIDRIPCLQQIKIAAQHDCVFPPSKNIFAESDHGTMVLSTMAMDANGIFIGTAPEASYALIRCEDRQSESLAEEDFWAEAVEYADSIGADIINSSLGYHDFDDASTNHKYSDMDGEKTLISHTASMIVNKGMILVSSAGNDGMGTWKKINFPADAKHILTVGAIMPSGVNAAFSAIGPTEDGRVKPDVMAYGSPTTVVSGRGTIIDEMGTSFSSPLVAGLMACLWQALPQKTARELIDLVIANSSNFAQPNNIYGYGIPNFWNAYNNAKP